MTRRQIRKRREARREMLAFILCIALPATAFLAFGLWANVILWGVGN